MSKTGWIVVILIVVLGAVLLLNRGPKSEVPNNEMGSTEQGSQVAGSGRVVYSVTDAAADMSAISEINMKVSGVTMHSASSGWVTVSTTPRTYNLLALNASGKSEVLADANVKAGTYDQVRLMVDSISVKLKAGSVKTAKLPSGELKINTMVVVKADMTTSVSFDFLADKSLHLTGNGNYIFAPVVKTEAKSGAEVKVDADSTVSVSGGHVDDSNSVGMDLDGSVKLNFEVDTSKKIELNTDGSIKVGGTTILQ